MKRAMRTTGILASLALATALTGCIYDPGYYHRGGVVYTDERTVAGAPVNGNAVVDDGDDVAYGYPTYAAPGYYYGSPGYYGYGAWPVYFGLGFGYGWYGGGHHYHGPWRHGGGYYPHGGGWAGHGGGSGHGGHSSGGHSSGGHSGGSHH